MADKKKENLRAKTIELAEEAKKLVFEKIDKVFNTNGNGSIFEKLDKSYTLQDYICTTAEKAARLMDNGMKWVEMKDCNEASEAKSAAWEEKVNRFIGQRPNFNN